MSESKVSIGGVFVSVFVLAALAYIFANAWNDFVKEYIYDHAKKDAKGNVIRPVDQMFRYAVGVSVACGIFLYAIYAFTKGDGIRTK